MGLACLLLLTVWPSVALGRPLVVVTSPADQAVVYGETWINVAFRSESRRPIVRLELLLDGRDLQSYVVPAPLLEGQKSFPVDLSGISPGPRTLTVRALDSVGEVGTSQVTLNVQPGGVDAGVVDRIPPVVSIYYPAQGAVVSGRVVIRAEVTDNVGVRNVVFYIDGKLHTIRMNAPPFQAEWDTIRYADGPHVLEARAKDTSGNEGIAAPVTVIVQNQAPVPAPTPSAPPPTPAPRPTPTAPPGAPGPGIVWSPPTTPPAPGIISPPVVAAAPTRVEPVQPAPPTPQPPAPAPDVSPPAPGMIAPPSPAPLPEPAYAPVGPLALAPPPVSADMRLATPPALSPEAPLPSPDSPQPTVPGTDLRAARAPEPELAAPTPPVASPAPAPAGLHEIAADAVIEAPGDVVARPAVEPVAAPALAVPALMPETPMPAPPPVSLEEVTPAPPDDIPAEVAVATPAVEALPEPELAVPAPSLPAPLEPEPAPVELESPPGALAPPPAVAAPDTAALPDEPGEARAPAAPPEAAVPVPVADPDAGQPSNLLSPAVDLYHEGPVAVVPGASITPSRRPGRIREAERPAPVVTPRVIVEERPAPAAVEAPGEASPVDALAAALTAEDGGPEAEAPPEAPAVAAEERPARAGLRRAPFADPSPAPPAPEAADEEAPVEADGEPRPLTDADADALADARVEFNGDVLPDEARPEVHDGVLMVSLKHLLEAADPALYWFADDGTVRAVTADRDLTVQVGRSRAIVNGESWELAAPVLARDDRVLVPVDLVARILGVTFDFDAREGLVVVRDAGGGAQGP